MKKNEIKLYVLDILKKVKLQKDVYGEEFYDEELTGIKMSFNAIDMVYLVLEIKKAFKIEFYPEDFLDYKFNSINSITDIIFEKLKLH